MAAEYIRFYPDDPECPYSDVVMDGDTLYLSRTTLRAEGDLFLCGMTPEELCKNLGTNVVFTDNDGGEFLYSILNIDL